MDDAPAAAPCAWAGSVHEFLAAPQQSILSAITHHLRETGGPQLFAWRNSLEALSAGLTSALPLVADCGLILEYELPRTGGRRPDLIFLNNGIILVIEFKNRVQPEATDLDQVLGYVRDLSEYHGRCRILFLCQYLIVCGLCLRYTASSSIVM